MTVIDLGTPDIEWRDRAACRQWDPEVFFPSRTDPHAIAHACSICQLSCPVISDCALETLALKKRPDEGVWAGVPLDVLPRQTATRILKKRAAGDRAGSYTQMKERS